MKQTIERRFFLVGIGLTLFGVVIIGRLFFLQVVSHDYYLSLAQRQHVASLDTEARRGNIYFREKDGNLLSAATTKAGYLLFIDPRKIKDAGNVYEKLHTIIPEINREDFLERASKKADPYEVIVGRLTDEDVENIVRLELSGVGLAPEEWRLYPAHELASHVLGFVGYEEDDIIGRYGIEYRYEDTLNGEEDYAGGQSTLGRAFLSWGRKIFRTPRTGADIALTIEPQAQLFVEEKLEELFTKWRGVRAGIVVMDPQSGRILAMATRPTFDPNAYSDVESLDVFVNPFVEHVYELGSVFKPLTIASGLDLGRITAGTTYFDQGFVEINGERIENYDGKGRGFVDIQRVLNESLNTGAVFVMQKTGGENLFNYFEEFGLGEKTDIELPGEVLGKLSNLESGREIEYATASFGQGIAVTPLAFLRAVSALANGGRLVKPFVVDRILLDGIPDIVTEPKIKKGIIKEETSEEITRMLVEVVDEALLGGTIKNEHYSIAAKTGTAQIANPYERGYSEEFLHSFFGYGPAYDAEFAIFLFLVNPRGERYASRTLAEPFMEIMEFLLSYYNVPPDR